MTPPTADNLEQAKALFFDGLEAFRQNRFEDAENRFTRSLELLPGRVSTQINLAATLIRLERPQEALALAECVLQVEPDNADAHFHRGNLLEASGRHEEALASFDQVQKAVPDNVVVLMSRGQILSRLHRFDAALNAFDTALKVDPTLAIAWSRRGSLLREMGRRGEAAVAFRQALAHGGDVELNEYYLASVDPTSSAVAAPMAYVEALFDDYAQDFETHLVDVLGYRAHKVLSARLIENARSSGRRHASAADLGCGTGLGGAAIRAICSRLVGVDISAKMLEKAQASGVYDELVQDDIVALLQRSPARFDLIQAVDVLIYSGDLGPVFAAARAALMQADPGTFCFSLELLPDAESADFRLQQSLRYAHSERYVRALAEKHAFHVERIAREPIREDQRESIPGLYVWLTT